MRRFVALLTLLLACPAALATPRQAARCALPVLERHAALMREMHQAMLERAVARDARLGDVAELALRVRALELALAQARAGHLAQTAPERLVLDRGPQGLAESATAADCCRGDAQIRQLEKDLGAARHELARHPHRLALEQAMRSALADPGWQRQLSALTARIAPLNRQLDECRALRDRPLQSLTE